MPNKTSPLFAALLIMLTACAVPDDPAPPQPPEAVGDELVSLVGSWSDCSGGVHLYRQEREVQIQCFDPEGQFSFENRGVLTPAASQLLDAHVESADLVDTTQVNFEGMCGAQDAVGVETVWVGEHSINFDQYCPPQGVLALYRHVDTIRTELASCGEEQAELVESFADECRSR